MHKKQRTADVQSGCSCDANMRCMGPISRSEWRVAAVALILSFVARWGALFPAYSTDDYPMIQNDGFYSWRAAVGQSRELHYLLRAVLRRLDALPPHSGTLGALLLSAVLVAMGLAICRLWGIQDRFPESLVAVCLMVLYPYQSELFTFRLMTLFLAIPLAAAFLALLLCVRSRWWWIASCGLLICSLFVYQVVLNYVLMALLFSVVFHVADAAGEDARFKHALGARLALVIAGVAVFGAIAALIVKVSGIPPKGRATLIGMADVAHRIRIMAGQIGTIFLRTEPMMPLATKLVLILAVLAAIAATIVFKESGRERLQPGAGRAALSVGLIAALGVPLCVGVILLFQDWWPVPRVLVQTGMFWGAVFALTYRFANTAGRRILVACFAVAVFSFLGISNHIFSDQQRVNLRDLAAANRIVARLESLPDFAKISGVAVIGGKWGFASPVETAQGDANVSAFSKPWSKTPLLNEVSGYNFESAPPDVDARAKAYCKTVPKWPAPQSIGRVDSFAVVCLAEN